MRMKNIIKDKDGKGVAIIYKRGCYHIVVVHHEKLASPVTIRVDEYSYRESDYATFDKIILSSGIELNSFKKTRIIK